ncbi:MAG: alpha-1 4-glucan-protein synthase, partial [Halobacteriaceae archaeon]
MQSDICVVIPTIRDYEFITEYISNARQHNFDLDRLFILFVTESFCDTDGMETLLSRENIAGKVVDENDREQWFLDNEISDYSHLIPAKSHAQTSFGLLYMWANEFEYGIFLDDDTRPQDDFDFFGRHIRNLEHDGKITEVGSETRWVNVLYQRDGEPLYPRGFPYSAMQTTHTTSSVDVSNVVASQGMWTKIPDLDAVRILMDGNLNGQAETYTSAADFQEQFVVERSNYLTVSSMNLAFKRQIIPVFYQLPMDDNSWNIGRFDDIWSGVFLKRACDILHDQIITGYPLCEHHKAPRSTFDDLQNEVPGLEINEHLWEIIDSVGQDATSYEE